MTKGMERSFPKWSAAHQAAFNAIKGLVVSWECLMVIDHSNPGDNKIFVTTDASDLWTGAVLSCGPSWELACPVAFDLMKLNDAQKCYPVHEKELLAIICALKKWRADLLGGLISIFTDHRTLENFDTQKGLSHREAHWQEFMAQFEMKIYYVKGKDNSHRHIILFTSCWGHRGHPTTLWVVDIGICKHYNDHQCRQKFLEGCTEGYLDDNFVKKITTGTNVPSMCEENGLWYVGDRLIIPDCILQRIFILPCSWLDGTFWCR